MIPILYESTETAFASNGLGRLRDCVSCLCYEERNGVYEVDFEYPVTGLNYEKIKLGRIIAVKHDDSDGIQPFDIVSYSRPINGVVSFHAVHISYRQRVMTIGTKNINSLAQAFNVLPLAAPSNPFSYQTDKTSTGYLSVFDGVPRSVRSILGGTEGSILDIYGGEYEWDKWTVKLWESRGIDRSFTIRYGVNLLDYTEESDYIDTYTAVIPYWYDESTKTLVKSSMVDSGVSSYGGRTDCIPLDLTDQFENKPSVADLRTAAQSYLTANKPYIPAFSIEINFVKIENEYKELSPLMKCKLCDTINVVFPMYGMNRRYKIVRTEYDVLLERFSAMELGTNSTTLAEALGIEGGSSGSGAADYVEEYGTSGNWTFAKYSSGRFEAWYRATGSTTCSTSTSNGWYRSNQYSISLPSIGITALSYAEVNVGVSGYAYAGSNMTTASTSTLNYYVWHLGSYSNVSSSINAHVVGTWS